MAERYAELILYHGECEGGIGQCRFNPDSTSPFERTMYSGYLRHVENYLCPNINGVRWGLHYWTSLDESLETDEDGAKRLINFAETHIPQAKGQIILIDAAHGTIGFRRVIKFFGATRDREDYLVALLKESGFQPTDKERERRKLLMEQASIWSAEDIESRLTKQGYGINGKWHRALKFH